MDKPIRPVDAGNRYLVGVRNGVVVVVNPPEPNAPLTRDDALSLAAHLIAMSDAVHPHHIAETVVKIMVQEIKNAP